MSDAAIFLWPLFGLFALGAAGAAWQASHPRQEIEAKEKIISRDWMLPRWRHMRLWVDLRSQQRNTAHYAHAAARRARIFASLAVIMLGYLLFLD